MNGQDGKLRLSLGSVELGLIDICNLRKGLKMECDIPPEFDSYLELCGYNIARVNIKVESSKFLIEVLGLGEQFARLEDYDDE